MEKPLLSPVNDHVFKRLFGGHLNVLADFLAAVLKLPVCSQELTVIDPHSLSSKRDDKISVLDVKVRSKEYGDIDVEVQVEMHHDLYFMRALPAILNGNKEAHAIVMGRDAGVAAVGYGAMSPTGTSWRKTLEAELGDAVDWKRVHFLGMLDRKLYLAMLKLSACHVYLTTPFILSWSFLEAAALGLPIVASDTAPVREFAHLKGLDFVEFTDVNGLAQRVLTHISHVDGNYFDDNADALAKLGQNRTIPAIRDVLLSGSSASDMGGALQEVVFEDESGETPVKKTAKRGKRP